MTIIASSIKTFDPRCITRNTTGTVILAVGQRRTGKTHLLEDLIYMLNKRYDYGIVITPTMNTIKIFQKHMPPCFIYNAFSEHTINSILEAAETTGVPNRMWGFIMIDDCNSDKKELNCVALKKLFNNGRHYLIDVFWGLQYIKDMPAHLRSQVEYVFMFKEKNEDNVRKLYDQFLRSSTDSFSEFKQLFKHITTSKKFTCLVLDTITSPDVDNQLYKYCAHDHIPSFTIGRPQFYHLNDMYRRKNDLNRTVKYTCAPTPRMDQTNRDDSVRNDESRSRTRTHG